MSHPGLVAAPPRGLSLFIVSRLRLQSSRVRGLRQLRCRASDVTSVPTTNTETQVGWDRARQLVGASKSSAHRARLSLNSPLPNRRKERRTSPPKRRPDLRLWASQHPTAPVRTASFRPRVTPQTQRGCAARCERTQPRAFFFSGRRGIRTPTRSSGDVQQLQTVMKHPARAQSRFTGATFTNLSPLGLV